MDEGIIKNIPINLDVNARKRAEGTIDVKLYSKDISTGVFEFSFMDEQNEKIELDDTYSARIMLKFKDSDSTYIEDISIEDGVVRFVFPHEFISISGLVTLYVYLTRLEKTSDVAAITFNVYRSEIDDVATDVVSVYDKNYEDILAEFEQALEDYKLTLPQADSVRADIDEILNQFSEDSQAKLLQFDTDAQQVIADNQTAFGLAESGRQNTYEQAEDNRNQASSQAVADWEQGADALLETVEGNEAARVDAEATRKTAETDRVSSESTRKTNETTRISNEDARKSAEVIRLASEVDRVNAESIREEFYEGFDGRINDLDSEKANRKQEEWITPTLMNGTITDTLNPENTLQYRKNQFGVVEFKGVFTPVQTGVSDFALPVGYRPISNKCKITVVSTDDVIGRINIIFGVAYHSPSLSNKEINMTGVSFPTV